MLALVALGANLSGPAGTPLDAVQWAVKTLADKGLTLTETSGWYRTPAWPAGSGPDFVNGAIAVETGLMPAELLRLLKETESEFGREQGERWGPRVLDLDLIAMGNLVLPDGVTQDAWRELPEGVQRSQAPDQLILPHPRLQDRAFVLVPVADIAPDWRHPRLNLTVRQMRDALPPEDLAGITVI